MHNAPAVTYPVGRSSIQGALCLVLWLLGLAATIAWAMTVPDIRLVAPAAALCAAVAAPAALAWWRTEAGALQWDGDDWQLHLRGPAAGGKPLVALDLQGALLLRWKEAGGAGGWLWLDRASAPARWDDLRRAVYSRAIVDAPPSSRAATP
jgi:toxin CptA